MFMKKSTQLLWGGFLKQEAFLQTQASFIACWQCSNCYSGFHLLRTLWYVAWWSIHFLYANFEYNQDLHHTLWLRSGRQNPRQQWNNKLLQGTGVPSNFLSSLRKPLLSLWSLWFREDGPWERAFLKNLHPPEMALLQQSNFWHYLST
jgi:hypothetical protein